MSGQSRGGCHLTKLACQSHTNAGPTTCSSETTKGPPDSTTTAQQATSLAPETVTTGVSFIRKTISAQLSTKAQNVIMASWRQGTLKQYQTHFIKWNLYCSKHHLDPLNATIENGIEFLTTLFDAGLGYSSINTARSALSTILPIHDGHKFGEHPLVIRFLKGVFELKPALPKYSDIWDVQTVLNHLKSYKPAEELSLKDLTLKVVMKYARLQFKLPAA